MGTIFTVIGWLVFGLIVGAIARMLLPGKQGMSWTVTALLGIVGSFAGEPSPGSSSARRMAPSIRPVG